MTKIAYLGLILIWGTTPLAIKWSTEGPGFLFAIAGRMFLGVLVTYSIIVILRGRMPWDRDAVRTYIAGGLGIYTAMGSTYWGAQHIPSGWVSVVFGLSPIITGALAAIWLQENALSRSKIAGIALAVAGLVCIFGHGAHLGMDFLLGALAVLIGTSCHAISAVTVKRIDAKVGGFAITAGGLTFAVPLLVATWWLADGAPPPAIPARAGWSIVYLGIVSSAIGFALYYYVLKRMTVSRVSLIALVTPVISLMLGHVLNGEPVGGAVVLGSSLILSGLLVYEFDDAFAARRRRRGDTA